MLLLVDCSSVFILSYTYERPAATTRMEAATRQELGEQAAEAGDVSEADLGLVIVYAPD